jgi:hypothetical protein
MKMQSYYAELYANRRYSRCVIFLRAKESVTKGLRLEEQTRYRIGETNVILSNYNMDIRFKL